ncbi:hypothetical protein TB2_045131 [Malus domestica]
MKDHESLDSRGKKPRRKLFNLELPAEECLSDEDEPDGGLGLGTDKSGCNNNASSSDLHLVRSNGLTDLNEPIQMDKVSASTSVVMSGNHLSSKEEIERQTTKKGWRKFIKNLGIHSSDTSSRVGGRRRLAGGGGLLVAAASNGQCQKELLAFLYRLATPREKPTASMKLVEIHERHCRNRQTTRRTLPSHERSQFAVMDMVNFLSYENGYSISVLKPNRYHSY